MKVLIADDHEIIRIGIRHILQEEFTLAEIGEAFDTDSLIEKALSNDWDIIISDISMPGGGGIEAMKKILIQKPTQRILIITTYPEDQYALKVIKAGACGFLTKDTAPENLTDAVKTILSGGRFIPPSIINDL
jgi:two-component system, NarL family, invasion response regulator UvrY